MELGILVTHPLLGVPVAIVFGIAVLLWLRKTERSTYPSRESLILLSPALCYLLIPIAGILFARTDFLLDSGLYEILAYIPTILAILEIPLALWTIWRMRGARLLMLTLNAMLLYSTFFTWLYAVMSISGTWL